MRFEWDSRKAAANLRKHGITFQDPDHSEDEDRQITFGLSLRKRLLVVSHTERNARTRIISARPINRKERVIYEEG
jgi:uncharacterized protein